MCIWQYAFYTVLWWLLDCKPEITSTWSHKYINRLYEKRQKNTVGLCCDTEDLYDPWKEEELNSCIARQSRERTARRTEARCLIRELLSMFLKGKWCFPILQLFSNIQNYILEIWTWNSGRRILPEACSQSNREMTGKDCICVIVLQKSHRFPMFKAGPHVQEFSCILRQTTHFCWPFQQCSWDALVLQAIWDLP